MGPLRHSAAAVAALISLPLAGVALALRPAWRRGFGQRLGFTPRSLKGGAWLHASSVGEAMVAARLGSRLLADAAPGEGLFVSATTTDGVDVLARLLPGAASGLAPLDHPWCVTSALRRLAPRVLVLIETELWPSLIARTSSRGVPVVLLSGRLSDRSFRRYRRLRPLLAPTLRRIARIGAQSELDRERFIQLGAAPERVRVTGDLKLEPAASPPRIAGDLARVLAGVPLLVAGSTHAGEEAAALAALRAALESGRALALVLAPRHLERVPEVCREVVASGRPLHLRSALPEAPLAAGEVLVLDGFGELASLYGAAAVCFVGGTLAPVGGHNLLEPLQAGAAVCFGPFLANARDAARLLEGCGAGRRVDDAAGLARAIGELLDDPRTPSRVEAGRELLAAHRGGLERSLALLGEALADASGMLCERSVEAAAR